MKAERFAWGGPLTVLPLADGEAAGVRVRRVVWLFLGLGIAARALRFALRMPLWPDEGYLAASLIDRGYLGLLEPLEYHQVAPFLFMWVQLTFVKLLGFSEFALRLFPLLCGIAALFVFRKLAARLVGGGAYVGAVALFAVSYPLIRYSHDAKPYGCDLLVALIFLALAVEVWRCPHARRPWIVLVAFTPVGIALSYPAAFTGGGVSVALGAVALERRERRAWLGWILHGLVLVASFAGLLALSAGKQAEAESYMFDVWASAFPPGAPFDFALWMLKTHTSEIMAYPVGAANGGSALTALCCAAGAWLLLRRRRWTPALLFFVPAALNLVAAALKRYPYGGRVRVALYLAPAICLLAALGLAWIVSRFPRSAVRRARLVTIVLALLALIPAASMARDIARPYKRLEYQRVRDFAVWFWHDKALDAELACMRTDLGLSFAAMQLEWGESCLYVCNQRIYSARHARGEPPDLSRVSHERPLRVVQFRVAGWQFDQEGFERWMAGMRKKYDLVRTETYRLSRLGGRGTLLGFNRFEVFEFVPR